MNCSRVFFKTSYQRQENASYLYHVHLPPQFDVQTVPSLFLNLLSDTAWDLSFTTKQGNNRSMCSVLLDNNYPCFLAFWHGGKCPLQTGLLRSKRWRDVDDDSCNCSIQKDCRITPQCLRSDGLQKRREGHYWPINFALNEDSSYSVNLKPVSIPAGLVEDSQLSDQFNHILKAEEYIRRAADAGRRPEPPDYPGLRQSCFSSVSSSSGEWGGKKQNGCLVWPKKCVCMGFTKNSYFIVATVLNRKSPSFARLRWQQNEFTDQKK